MLTFRFKTLGVAAAAVGLAAVLCPTAGAVPLPEERTASEKQLEAWWDDLEKGELDATRALLKLADRPKEAVAFLKGKMKPLKIDAERVKALLTDLGSDKHDVWKA